MNEITLNVPQGIGDIFWVYQKFAPYVGAVNFNVMRIGDARPERQTRALRFLKVLPKVKEIRSLDVPPDRYVRVSKSFFSMEKALLRAREFGASVDYGCNFPLERGVRLEEIDPGYAIEETVSLPVEGSPAPYARYVVVYVSGDAVLHGINRMGLWSPDQWVQLVKLVYKKYGLDLPIVVIGASYDLPAASSVRRALGKFADSFLFIDLEWPKVFGLLAGAAFFMGHQSGLNVIADQLGTRQLMLYMESIRPMAYAWCKKAHIGPKIFNAGFFSRTPEEIVAGLSCEIEK